MGHMGTFRDIYGHIGTYWDILGHIYIGIYRDISTSFASSNQVPNGEGHPSSTTAV